MSKPVLLISTFCILCCMMTDGHLQSAYSEPQSVPDKVGPKSSTSKPTLDEIKLKDLPGLGGFKSDPYLRAAIVLQGMGRMKAQRLLQILAKKDEYPNVKVILLCRMLYVKKPHGAVATHL